MIIAMLLLIIPNFHGNGNRYGRKSANKNSFSSKKKKRARRRVRKKIQPITARSRKRRSFYKSDKSVLEVFQLSFGDGAHVEADGQFPSAGKTVVLRDVAVTTLFFARDRLRRHAERVRLSRLHLDESIHPRLERDDIRLSERRGVIAFEDLITAFFQVFAGGVLSAPSQNFFTKVLR